MANELQAPIKENQLHRWRLLTEFGQRLEAAFQEASLHPTWADPQRVLQIGDYLSLFLLGVFNPVITSMRGLCQASHLQRVQREICHQAVSKSSFSEAQHVVDPGLLKSVYDSLAVEVARRRPAPRQTDHPYAAVMQIVDSTLWYALPRMHWAIWREQHGVQ